MRILIITIVALTASNLGLAEIAQSPEIEVLQERGSSILIEYKLKGYEIESLEINGKICSRITLPKQVTFLETGFPELPTVARNIIIPDDGLMDYRIIDIEYESVNVAPIVPSKGNLLRTVDPNTVPYVFDKFYQTDTWWPEKNIEIYEPFILRDYRGLTIRFNPFQYNPARNELKIARRVAIELYEVGKGGANVIIKKKTSITREFADLYENIFLNFNQARYDSISERAGRMVIITADAYMSNMQPFKEWKRRKGIETKMVPISSIGNNQTSIKNFIQSEYNAGDLVWILLVGDGNEVVPAIGTVGSATGDDADPVYAYTAGSDNYPDLFISRFSSRSGNATNIDKQVSRSIGYEKTPMTGADWYHIGLGVASNEGSPPDYERCNWLRDSLLNYTYTEVKSQYQGQGGSTNGIKQDIETGLSIVNYIGHGVTSGWTSVSFAVSDFTNLNNPWMLPFVISVACLVGNFDGADCYCEASVTAGEINQPDGFLVHWGSSILQSWVPPCYGQEGAVNLLTHDKKNTAGGIFFNGACYMIEYYGGTAAGVEMAQTWHIFGDASIQLRTDTPQPITVNHMSILNLGQTTFDVSVPGVANALVGLYVDTLLIGHGYTNASGNVTIDLDPAPSLPGTMHITVTGYNKIPYLDSIPITTLAGPYIAMGQTILNDAGGNGQANPGEAIDYGVWAKNIGIDTAFSVYGRLSTSDSFATITVDSSWYGNIPISDSTLSSPYYDFTIADDCPNNYPINFALEFHDSNDSIWTSNPVVTVYAPVLTYQYYSISDGSGILDPGETADLVVTIKNEGGADAEGVTSTLFTNSSYITIDDSAGVFGDIMPGDTANNAVDPYTVTASASTPHGTEVDFSLIVEAGIYVDTLEFSLVVGQLVPSDTGYYYVYYSGGPHTLSPVFDWVAIDSTQSQYPGVSMNLPDDSTVVVILPFTFKYYGTNYNQISISSNGWIAMGSVTSSYFTNYGIPDVNGPAAMIAALWDDLHPGNAGQPSDVYYYYDAVNHRFIIEYFRVEHFISGYHETFEIILLDPAYYPTPTGDGEILVQYLLAMQQDDNTLGIENYSETVGIQYYLDGAYHELAVPVTDSFALKYTTYPPDYTGIEESSELTVVPVRTMMGVLYPNPFKGQLSISYQVATRAEVGVQVYDVMGRLVRTLTQGVYDPGYYTVSWDGRDDVGRRVPAGVYFVKFNTDDYQRVEKTVLLR